MIFGKMRSTVHELLRREKKVSFFQEIDLLGIEEDILIGMTGRIGMGFRIEGLDLLLCEEARIHAFLGNLEKFLNHIPEGFFLHFLIRRSRSDKTAFRTYRAGPPKGDPISEYVFLDKEAALEERPFSRREVFLFFGFDMEGLGKKSVLIPSLKTVHSRVARRVHRSAYEKSESKILRFAEQARNAFSELGIGFFRMDESELTAYLYELLNPDYAEKIPAASFPFKHERGFPASETLRSRLVLSVPEVRREAFWLNSFQHRSINLRSLPEELDLKSMKDFEEALPEEYLLSVFAALPEQDREFGRLKRLGNMARSSSLLAFTKNYEALEKHQEADRLLTQLAEKGEKLFRLSVSVLLRSRDERELARLTDTAFHAFPKLGSALGVVEDMNHDRLFLSTLPLQGEENPLSYTVPSAALAHLLPLQARWRGTRQPSILLKSYCGEALCLDLFDASLPAKHALMIGTTGSGKSFFTNFLLCHFLIESASHHVVVIDVGGSYHKLAHLFGGAYLEVECSERYALNPFPRKSILFKERGTFDPDLIAFLTGLLERMVAGKIKLTPVEARILERSVIEAYAPLSEDEAPLLSDIRRVLSDYGFGDEEDRARAYQFSKELAIWTEGRFGRLLNRPGTLDLENRFLVFDLSKLTHHPELQSILFFVIRGALTRKLEDVSLKKIFVIDEGWRFFDDEAGSLLIQELYRTARKYNGLVLSISQSPEDFIRSKAATAILANSYVKYVLKLQKSHDILTEFELNENEIKAVRELETRPGEYAEVFIKFFDRSVIARVEPTSLEYWIATTSPEDTVTEARERLAHPDWDELKLLRELSKKYPYGRGMKGKMWL